jgi:hypothetical protein
MNRRRFLLPLLALCGFLASELVSPFPQFHRHANELSDLLAVSRGTRIGSPALHGGSSSTECPACVIFGLSAMTASGPRALLAAAPAAEPPVSSFTGIAPRTASVSRGRAPPPA